MIETIQKTIKNTKAWKIRSIVVIVGGPLCGLIAFLFADEAVRLLLFERETVGFWIVLYAIISFIFIIHNPIVIGAAKFVFVSILWIQLIGASFLFVGIIFDFNSNIPIYELFGIDDKHEALKFVGWGIGGMIITLGALAVNRRAEAQEQNSNLVEKGNDDARFQHMIEDLGHAKTVVRIATFYRFYYLASKDVQTSKFRNDVFEILCSCLRTLFIEKLDDKTDPREQQMAQQTLFDILFKGKFKSNDDMKSGLVRDEIKADLRNICFTDIDFSDANLSGVDFRKAEFKNVNLDKARSVEGADFRGVTINGEQISRKHLPLLEGIKCYLDDTNP